MQPGKRGLCFACYWSPARALYPPGSENPATAWAAGRGATGRNLAPLPAKPTPYPAGTPEKLAVLEARAAAGEQLFHPLDA